MCPSVFQGKPADFSINNKNKNLCHKKDNLFVFFDWTHDS